MPCGDPAWGAASGSRWVLIGCFVSIRRPACLFCMRCAQGFLAP